MNLIKMLMDYWQNGRKLFLLFVVFISAFIGIQNISALGVPYNQFDWDSFEEVNKTYWEGICDAKENEKDKETCTLKFLANQKKFYVKLYKMLAIYDSKNLHINDKIILETVFFDLNPSSFSDDPTEYTSLFESIINSIIFDGDDTNVEDDYTSTTAAKYYETEKDSLKTLVKNMIANSTSCYGIYTGPTKHTQNDGSSYYTCDNGGSLQSVEDNNVCADKKSQNTMGFWKYFVSKWTHKLAFPIFFLGSGSIDENYNSCMEMYNDFPNGTKYVYNDEPEVSTYHYWDFLANNKYFDNKAHLKSYYYDILKDANVDCMTDSICTNSLEAAGLYDKYYDQILDARLEIIEKIIGILKVYGIDAPYNEYGGSDYIEGINNENMRNSYYWPIGSDETEERDGIIYADKDPASTEVESYFGSRINPVTGESETHYGIDIVGEENITNVVSVYTGEVDAVMNYCSNGDTDCNDGYGNMIIVSHSNGDYTVYAHLAPDSITVSVGDKVFAGQLIAKVGKTGRTLTSNLHYELRSGGNDVAHAVDPLGVINAEEPRPVVGDGNYSVHTTSFTRDEFISIMTNYCNTHSCGSMLSMFANNAGRIYDASISSNVNPELVVVRAIVEGFSPSNKSTSKTYNYWGLGCANEGGLAACASYSSLEAGVAGFAKYVTKYATLRDMMSKYAYIGAWWYNPGSWGLGGCKYYDYIKQYMSSSRAAVVGNACAGGPCSKGGGGSCLKSTAEDQDAYASYQIQQAMGPQWVNIFGY